MTSAEIRSALRIRTTPEGAGACFAASVGCVTVGGAGWLVNWITPYSTNLDMLLLVGGFYFAMGLRGLAAKLARRLRPSSSGHAAVLQLATRGLDSREGTRFHQRGRRSRNCRGSFSSHPSSWDDLVAGNRSGRRILAKSAPPKVFSSSPVRHGSSVS